MNTTLREVVAEYGSYYVVTAEVIPGLKMEWWIHYDPTNGWWIGEYTSIPSRYGPAGDFK